MNAHSSSAAQAVDYSARQLQDHLRQALPALENRRQVAPLKQFESVDAVVAELKPSEPIFCITPQKIRDAAAGFLSFPGRALYAVKCNPHPVVLETLYGAGVTDFDVASLEEVRLIDSLFGAAGGKFFNNPAKTRPAIQAASQQYGIRFYTADCVEEIEKIVEETGNTSDLVIAVRLATRGSEARYILSTKFGAQPDEAIRLLQHLNGRGIKAGISFHVGSQCLHPRAFHDAVELAGKVAANAGVELSVLNVGGGFPAPYPGDDVVGHEHYFGQVARAVRSIGLPRSCIVLCEPGRALVATSGTTVVQVVMRRGKNLFLNDGVFGTLQELGHPKERRPVRLIRNDNRASANGMDFKIWGPTCDSNDVLGASFHLPGDVREGDWIEIGMMGAYSLSMRTHFNGFFADQIIQIGA